jgi:hypothetical protein
MTTWEKVGEAWLGKGDCGRAVVHLDDSEGQSIIRYRVLMKNGQEAEGAGQPGHVSKHCLAGIRQVVGYLIDERDAGAEGGDHDEEPEVLSLEEIQRQRPDLLLTARKVG